MRKTKAKEVCEKSFVYFITFSGIKTHWNGQDERAKCETFV